MEVFVVKDLLRHLSDTVFAVKCYGIGSRVSGSRSAIVSRILIPIHIVVDGLNFPTKKVVI